MFDATRLLDQLLGSGAGAGSGRQEVGGQPQAAPDLLGTARDFLSGGGIGGGAVAGALAALMLGSKTGRQMASTAVQVGAVAVIGGLAWNAYRNYREGKPVLGGPSVLDRVAGSAPVALPGAPPPQDHAVLLLRSMIAAAEADGVIDASERERIVGQLSAAGIGQEERAFLDAEMARPWSPPQFARAATTPEMRSEVYLAALLAIDSDTEAERTYLRYLASTLGIDEPLAEHLQAAATAARGGAAAPAGA